MRSRKQGRGGETHEDRPRVSWHGSHVATRGYLSGQVSGQSNPDEFEGLLMQAPAGGRVSEKAASTHWAHPARGGWGGLFAGQMQFIPGIIYSASYIVRRVHQCDPRDRPRLVPAMARGPAVLPDLSTDGGFLCRTAYGGIRLYMVFARPRSLRRLFCIRFTVRSNEGCGTCSSRRHRVANSPAEGAGRGPS